MATLLRFLLNKTCLLRHGFPDLEKMLVHNASERQKGKNIFKKGYDREKTSGFLMLKGRNKKFPIFSRHHYPVENMC